MVEGHKEKGVFHPHGSKKGTSSKSVNGGTSGDSSMKGLPKSFQGYDVMKRRKVTVTKGIKRVTFKNGRSALQGKSPISGITITRIVSSK